MAAVVNINRFTGVSPGVSNDITSVNTRANAEDAHTVAGTSNPVSIPAAGTKYSFWVSTQLEVISGLIGTIDNLRWFMTGALDAGVALLGETASSYVEATGAAGDSGDQLTIGNYPSLTGVPVDLTAFTAGSPKSIIGSISGVGVVGDFLVYQFGVGLTAQPGSVTPITISWRYDET